MKIGTILDQIDLGVVALPEFQRGYVKKGKGVQTCFLVTPRMRVRAQSLDSCPLSACLNNMIYQPVIFGKERLTANVRPVYS